MYSTNPSEQKCHSYARSSIISFVEFLQRKAVVCEELWKCHSVGSNTDPGSGKGESFSYSGSNGFNWGRSRQLSLRAGKSMDSGNGVGFLPHFEIIIYNLSNPLMGLLWPKMSREEFCVERSNCGILSRWFWNWPSSGEHIKTKRTGEHKRQFRILIKHVLLNIKLSQRAYLEIG